MARICTKCAGDGVDATGQFCRCAEGKIKKAMHEAKLKAELKLAEEVKKALKSAKEQNTEQMDQMQLAFNERSFNEYNVGDWVRYAGLICYVEDVTESRLKICGKRMNGEPFAARDWVKKVEVTRLPLERFKNANKYLIDLALQTNDLEWFEELTGGKGNDRN